MGDVPLLRNSERSDFKRCIKRWQWRYNEHLVPIQHNVGPLVFGTFGHLALAEWYQPGNVRGPHPAETWMKITENYWDSVKSESFGSGLFDDEIEGTWEDARELGAELLVNYVNEYGNDDHWEVLWAERSFKQGIPHPNGNNPKINPGGGTPGPIVNYVGTIDLVVRDHLHNGRIRFIDHKFMKSIQTDHLSIDDQNGGYLAIATHQLRREGLIGEKEAVRDLVYNFIRKAKQPDRPRNALGEYLNQDGSVSKRQPPPFFERFTVSRTAAERNQQIKRIGEEALWLKAVRDGRLPIIKSPKDQCRWDCSFFNLCAVDESGGDVEETKKMLFRKEDPYQEYEDNAKSPKLLSERQ